MEVNEDFFKSSKELVISVSDTNPLNVKFGAKGSRYFVINDITIIPHDESNVRVQFELKGLEPMVIEIKEPINIFQRQTNPYPSIGLFVNEKIYVKKQIYEGTITICGNCDVIQKPFQIIDS